MNPAKFADQVQEIFNLYNEAELEIIRKIKNNLLKDGYEREWAERKLSEIGKTRMQIARIIKELENESSEMTKRLIKYAEREGRTSFEREFAEVLGAKPESNLTTLGNTSRILDDLNDRLDDAHRTILRRSMDGYRDIVGSSVAKLSTGTTTLTETVSEELARFAGRGITSFVDSVGRVWGMGEYAEMATRTGMMRAALDGYQTDAEAYGEDLIIITSHTGCCPLCAPWQGRVLSLNGTMETHPDCEGRLSEAEGAGLFHPNCLHSFTIYHPGYTLRSPPVQSTEANELEYKARQYMRYCERNARKQLRVLEAVKGVDKDAERKARNKFEQWDDRAKQTADNFKNLRYQRERIFGRISMEKKARRRA